MVWVVRSLVSVTVLHDAKSTGHAPAGCAAIRVQLASAAPAVMMATLRVRLALMSVPCNGVGVMVTSGEESPPAKNC